mgnify:CR=1 FL=1
MSVSMREMLEAGCQFVHQTRFSTHKMAQYIFGARNKIHIINLEKTVEKLAEAEKFVRELSARGGKILFVDTKRGGRDTIIEQAQRAGCCYVDQRWLGGTLTNFKTVKQTIRHLKDMEATQEAGGLEKMSKKEALDFTREVEKLNKSIGGIKDMDRLPQLAFIIDPNREEIAVKECRKLGIPIVAVTDTNCDPDVIDYIIPGNDDAIRAIKLFVTAMAEACLEGEAMRKDSKNKDAEEELKKAADAEAKAEEAPAVEAAAE